MTNIGSRWVKIGAGVVALVVVIAAVRAMGGGSSGTSRISASDETSTSAAATTTLPPTPVTTATTIGASAKPTTPTTAAVPATSHDVVFTSSGGDTNRVLHTVSPTGNGAATAVLTSASVDTFDPAWSPAYQRIAYAATTTGEDTEIWVQAAKNAKDRRQLTHNQLADTSPAWLPGTGKLIAWTSEQTGQPQVWVMRDDGSHPVQVTDEPNGARDPSWSPDGKNLAYVRIANSDRGTDIAVIAASAVRGVGRAITTNPADDENPAWSPDGTSIAFDSTRTAAADIWIMGRDGEQASPARKLTSGRQTDGSASHNSEAVWSRDGKQLAFTSNRLSGVPQIFVMNRDGSNPHAISTGGGAAPTW